VKTAGDGGEPQGYPVVVGRGLHEFIEAYQTLPLFAQNAAHELLTMLDQRRPAEAFARFWDALPDSPDKRDFTPWCMDVLKTWPTDGS
jgi:hypothetical protein